MARHDIGPVAAHETTAETAVEATRADDAVELLSEAAPAAAVGGVATARRAPTDAGADPLGGTPADASVVSALQRSAGKGTPLPGELADRFGEQLGADLSAVRIHHDAEADELAAKVQAKAFTHGSDIYFARGAYAPASGAGEQLLGHELAHVVQQRGGRASAGAVTIGRADDAAEADADRVAAQVMRSLRTAAEPASGAGAERVQRSAAIRRAARSVAELRKLFEPSAASSPGTPAAADNETDETENETETKTETETENETETKNETETGEAENENDTKNENGDIDTDTDTKNENDETETDDEIGATQPEVAPESAKTPMEQFAAEVGAGKAPANAAEAGKRLTALEQILTRLTGTDRKALLMDDELMDKAMTFVGRLQFMRMMAAITASTGSETLVDRFAAEVGAGKAPADAADAEQRLSTLESILERMSAADRTTLLADDALMEKAIAFVGPGQYKGLLAAVAVRAAQSGPPVDVLIRHCLGSYLGSAAGSAARTTGAMYDSELEQLKQADAGQVGTAIHRGIGKYQHTALTTGYGKQFSTAITEYFTRKVTGYPDLGVTIERRDHQDNYDWLTEAFMPLLGSDTPAREKVLAEAYFAGRIEALQDCFVAFRMAEQGNTEDEAEDAWEQLLTDIDDEYWGDAEQACRT